MEVKNHYLEDFIFEPLRLYFSFTASLFISFSLLRVYEFFAFSNLHTLPDNVGFLFYKGAAADLLFSFQLSAVFLPLFGFAHYLSFQNGKRYKVFSCALLFLIAVAIDQYFILSSVPLGSDFWGYSLTDIKTTVSSSTSIGLVTILGIAFSVVLIILLSIGLTYIEVKNPIFNSAYLLLMGLSIFIASDRVNPRNSFSSEEAFNLSQNKTAYFFNKSISYFTETYFTKRKELDAERGNIANKDFPLMKKMDYQDVLGPYFNIGDSLPNIVVIQVEGLGKSFVGKNAPKGGFTPFLDSLMEHSLHWDNFLSSAGRTFGILPSFFGSLPFGNSGFMELGDKTPNHLSLITLLKKQGYYTSFYYGGNASFDGQQQFLEKQQIDNIVSDYDFPATYKKMKENEGGFTWGYADKDVFTYSNILEQKIQKTPRLDIFMTLTTHEPFVVPESRYQQVFNRYAAKSKIAPEILTKFRGVFECLLYTDDAIKNYIQEYSQRPEYRNTIFIITGDHRMIPVPHENAIDRFHVPMIIWSPMLNKSQAFKGVGTHHNMAATIMGFLHHNYKIAFPSELPFIAGVIDNSTEFHSKADQAIMRNKNDLSCYVFGKYYLSDDAVFEIKDGMKLEPIQNEETLNKLKQKLDNFRTINRLVCEQNKLFNGEINLVKIASYILSEKENNFIKSKGFDTLSTDDRFEQARKMAFSGNYPDARILLKYILNSSPNYSDVRILLGRSYMWGGQYEPARKELKEAIKRAPTYYDAYLAIIDCELYSQRPDSAKYWLRTGLKLADDIAPLKEKQQKMN